MYCTSQTKRALDHDLTRDLSNLSILNALVKTGTSCNYQSTAAQGFTFQTKFHAVQKNPV